MGKICTMAEQRVRQHGGVRIGRDTLAVLRYRMPVKRVVKCERKLCVYRVLKQKVAGLNILRLLIEQVAGERIFGGIRGKCYGIRESLSKLRVAHVKVSTSILLAAGMMIFETQKVALTEVIE